MLLCVTIIGVYRISLFLTYIYLIIFCRRTLRNLSRNKSGIIMRLSQNLIFGLFIAFFLIRLKNDVLDGAIQDRVGVFYQCLGGTAYTGLLNAVALCK